MIIPPSPYFHPLHLTHLYNARRSNLPEPLRLSPNTQYGYGSQCFLGIPFQLGLRDQFNVILLDKTAIAINIHDTLATYLLFVHAVEDRKSNYLDGFADNAITGHELGQRVSEYTLAYEDTSSETIPIFRRIEIQQSHVVWGVQPFATVPVNKTRVFNSATDYHLLGKPAPRSFGSCEIHLNCSFEQTKEHLWVYALPNPYPQKRIRQVICTPCEERSLIYAISTTQVEEHPLRPGLRRVVELPLPDGAALNALDALEEADIDLGTFITGYGKLQYNSEEWLSDAAEVQPTRLKDRVIVEFSAHPQAKLFLATSIDSHASYELTTPCSSPMIEIQPANRPVHLRVVESGSTQPVPVRLHIHGEAGEYLPPRNRHRKVNPYWIEDYFGELINGNNQYCYIPGDCRVNLPLGKIYLDISRGYEVTPLRTCIEITPDTKELTLELNRSLDWRSKGWVSADTHVHFLSPQTALLEGAAEGVNVVNLLASQWGELFTNVTDFDGHTTLGARELGGDGEFLVRVGTENRMQVLGHISLLGYSGAMIEPLCTGGPSESAIGDIQETTLADWARQCIQQKGLVIMPHSPNPQGERAADIVLGLIHALEMSTTNPYDAQLNPYGIADWYRYLNLGYHIPVVGGSDKMSAAMILGGSRTYAYLGDKPFTYEQWMKAVRVGNTFVTVGPLAQLTVEGVSPGNNVHLPASGGTLNVSWKVESANMPVEAIEIVVGGLTFEQTLGTKRNKEKIFSASGSFEIRFDKSTWIALRVRGSYRNIPGDIAAHTSAVQVLVENSPLFCKPDAIAVLEQIEGTMTYLNTLAPRPDVILFKKLLATLTAAQNQMHQRMHQNGIYHKHTHLHDH